MKLKHNDRFKADNSNPEFENFKRQLLRQAGGFGVHYGADTQTYFGGNSIEVDRDRSLQTLRKSAASFGAAVLFLGAWIQNMAFKVVDRYQNADALKRILKLSDSALQDIGLDREQLEALRLSGGSISDYVAGSRNRSFMNAQNAKDELKFTLIDCSVFERTDEHNLNRAA